MDKYSSLDNLFAKARQQAPVASLDETKATFLNAVNAPAVKSNLFTSKFRLMLYTIATFATIGIVSLAVLKPEKEKTVTSKTNQPSAIASHETKRSKPFTNSAHHTVLTKASNPEATGELSLFDQISEALILPKTIQPSWWYDRSSNRNTLPQDSIQLQIPELTEEQISAAQKQKKSMLKAILKRDNKRGHYAYLPSGTFQYADKTVSLQAFFMQTTEVTNLEYRTFLVDLLIQGKKEDYLKAKPDEQMWVKQFDKGMEPMTSLYFSHPAYNNYPVVNISREGAEMYCKWLTKAYNDYAITKKVPQINDVRLPSRTEWTYAASSCGKYTYYPWPGEFVHVNEYVFLANHKPLDGKFMDDGIFHTGHVTSYNPSEFGLYCISGNVAEMVYNSDNARSQPGTAGGDWTSDAEHIKLYAEDLNNGITEPRCTIGFRVVFTHLGRL